MFKKKNELPPWPKPPTNDQMLEDINSALADDPVFTEFTSCEKAYSEKSDVDITYEQVKTFLCTSKQLEETMLKLGELNVALQTNNDELKKKADDIRQQAVKALK